MEELRKGMLAVSRAGHDKNSLYLIIACEGDCVWLCDGRLRTLEHPKRKKIKHLQVNRKIPDEWNSIEESTLRNEEIRSIIRKYSKIFI